MLTFLKKVKQARQHDADADKYYKKKETMAANKHRTDATLLWMAIDRELPEMIRAASYHQTNLDL